jgi:hypothetical protein
MVADPWDLMAPHGSVNHLVLLNFPFHIQSAKKMGSTHHRKKAWHTAGIMLMTIHMLQLRPTQYIAIKVKIRGK